jgi:ferric-chelate reductase
LVRAYLKIQQKFLMHQDRIRASQKTGLQLATPSNILIKSLSRTANMLRWLSYPQFTPSKTSYFKIPPIATLLLLLTYLGTVLGLEFYKNDIQGAQHYTALGLRAAWLGIAQIPLLILLAGKNNLIGFVTGLSYERLNIFHRWVARTLLLTQTLHFGFQAYGWSQYGLVQLEWKTDTCFQTGIAAYAILLWINLSTLAPIRNFSYEFFVVQHIITFFGVIIAIMMHLPSTALYSRTYIYIGIGIYCLDRLIRTTRCVYHNCRPASATLTAMDGATKIRISSKRVKKWSPGSHVFISIPRVGFGQSHPATIASIPSSHGNDLILILKTHRGFTKRIMILADPSVTSITEGPKQEIELVPQQRIALIDGPYGGSHPDFATFDTVLLISASTGVTFTLSVLLDIAHRSSSLTSKLPVRNLEFVWVVKRVSWISWVFDELHSAFRGLQAAGIEILIQIYVTGEENTKDLNHTRTQLFTPNQPIDGDRLEIRTITSWVTLKAGRPSFQLIQDLAENSSGRMGVAVCGPVGLSASVRNTVAGISKGKLLREGTGVRSITLHTEGFSW